MLAVGMFGRGSDLGNRIEALLRRGRTYTARASASTVLASAMALGGMMVAGSFAPRWIAFAQDSRPEFEVASIKPSHSTSNNGGVRFNPGGLTADAPLRFLIVFAYHIKDFQLTGGPAWVESERYEIDAKAPGTAMPDQLRLMTQSLLEDRFHLKLRRRTEQRPAYILSPAKGGVKMRESGADCAALANEDSSRGRTCGAWFATDDEFNGTKISMAQFVEWLAESAEQPVVDKTGFTGSFDVHLKWGGDAGTSIFTAVGEQMGLKVLSGKGPVEFLTIDHVEKPDAN
jgi:uncharacterized protein (TIGR03435 family)